MARVIEQYVSNGGGIAKVQAVPFSYWSELKMIGTGNELLDFVRKHEDLEIALRTQLRNSASRVIDNGLLKDSAEVMFVDGILKSAILRAGGSAKASWAPWVVSGRNISYETLNTHNSFIFEESGKFFSVPSHLLLKIDEESFRRINTVAWSIFNYVDPKKEKYCLRADFVIEVVNEKPKWWLIDVGESNLGFVLGSQLHSFAGTGLDFASNYVEMVKGLSSGEDNVLITYQDEKMLHGMPFEFKGIIGRLGDEGISVNMLPKADLLSLIQQESNLSNMPLVLRFFRKAEVYELEQFRIAEGRGVQIIDSTRFIPLMQKHNIEGIVDEQLRADLQKFVSIPMIKRIDINPDPKETWSEILAWMQSNNLSEIVLKPGTPTKSATTAFFYSIENPRHVLEMLKTIEKIKKSEVRTVVAEELVGNGTIEDRKVEVRVWCLRN